MTNKQKKPVAASKEATENWDDAPAPGSRTPDPAKPIEPKPANETPAEPTNKVDADEVKATLDTAAANMPVDPETPRVVSVLEEMQAKLGKNANPKTQLVAAFKEIASVVGADKAKRILVENFGTEEPETLKSSQLLDAIDMLYGAA